MAIIKEIKESSPFYGVLKRGDRLVSVNGTEIRDLLDYMYCTADEKLTLTVERDGKLFSCTKKCAGHTGLDFDSYLMDKERSCRNKCVFCFIDQLPENMRSTLYYKDDDYRLSLLYGNYVTLTNLSESDAERIVKMKISPLNISVHTTHDVLRVKMMKNPNAAGIMKLLRRFADAGINLRCQIVLCKGLNDGEELMKTLRDLRSLYPAVSSVSVVPVGLTAHRSGLYALTLFNKDECSQLIDVISAFGGECLKTIGTRLIYEADEFYIKAERPVPPTSYYEEFEQLANGVGTVALYTEDFLAAVSSLEPQTGAAEVSWATGMSMKKVFPELIAKLRVKLPSLKIHLYPIRNDHFGETITVAGLVTGGDIIKQLRGKELGSALIIPQIMLRDDKFLDDVSVGDIEKELGIKVVPVGGADELVGYLRELCGSGDKQA